MEKYKSKMMVDHRRDPRRNASLDSFIAIAGEILTPCYVKNISFGGVCIKSNTPLKCRVGDDVELRITDLIGMRNGDILIMKGVVVSEMVDGCGIKFHAPELGNFDALLRLAYEPDATHSPQWQPMKQVVNG